MSGRKNEAILALVIGTFAVVLSAAVYGLPRGEERQPVAGQTYSYSCTDLSHVIVRSNGGAQMQDFLPMAGTACLTRGATLTIRNADPRAWLYLYGTLVQYPYGIRRGHNLATNEITLVEGGVLVGGGCAMCLSVAFLRPGERATYVFDDTFQTFPNDTVGHCKGCAPMTQLRGQTWRLVSPKPRASRPEPSRPLKEEAWTTLAQPKCCTCIPFQLWNAGWNSCNSGTPWALKTARDNERGDVLRLELREGDHWWNEVDKGNWYNERSLAEAATTLNNGTTYWEGYSFLLECGAEVGSDGRSSGSYWLIIENIHNHPGLPNGVVPFQTELLPGGYFAINARTQNGNAQQYVYIAPTPLVCGVWHDVVRQFDIDPNGGFLREWLDGQQIVDFNGKLGNAGDSPYVVFELYRADYYGVANTYAERVANFQIGTTSLASRIGNPRR